MAFNDIQLIMILLAAFQLKHFLADYVLQTGWMSAGKAKEGLGFVPPLLAHGATHAALTALIILFAAPALVWLALIDLGAHSVLDRLKASAKLRGRNASAQAQPYWIIFGADQFGHHLTHYLIIWFLILHHG